MNGSRSIGVSNFGVTELQILIASAKIKPAANQVRANARNLHAFEFIDIVPHLDSSSSLRLRQTSSHFVIRSSARHRH